LKKREKREEKSKLTMARNKEMAERGGRIREALENLIRENYLDGE
jgi:hypothetical protein